MTVILRKIPGYNPLNDSVYMSPRMKQYFEEKLYQELQKLIEEEIFLSESLAEVSKPEPDFVDPWHEKRPSPYEVSPVSVVGSVIAPAALFPPAPAAAAVTSVFRPVRAEAEA